MLCTTRDIPWLTKLLSDPEVMFYCSDDGVAKKRHIKRHVEAIIGRPDITTLSPAPGKMVLSFVARNAVMHEMHIAVRPDCGLSGREIKAHTEAACAWMIRNRGARKIIAEIPSYNLEACRMAAAGGLQRAGVLTSAFLKGGKLHDLIVYQSRDEDVQRILEDQ